MPPRSGETNLALKLMEKRNEIPRLRISQYKSCSVFCLDEYYYLTKWPTKVDWVSINDSLCSYWSHAETSWTCVDFSLNHPHWANSVIEPPFSSVCVSVCLSRQMQFFQGLSLALEITWLVPRPLIGPPSLPPLKLGNLETWKLGNTVTLKLWKPETWKPNHPKKQ